MMQYYKTSADSTSCNDEQFSKERKGTVEKAIQRPPLRGRKASIGEEACGDGTKRCRISAFTPVYAESVQCKRDPMDCKAQKPKRNFKFHLESMHRKEMAIQKRLMANARERTRVHTLGAAFEKLRQAIPSYSEDQKLSKLAVLRVAICYIAALTDLAGSDSFSQFAVSVNNCTRILNEEKKSKSSKRNRARQSDGSMSET